MRPNAKHVRNKEGRLYISVWFSDLLSLTGHDPYERKPSRTTGGSKKKKKSPKASGICRRVFEVWIGLNLYA